MKKKIKDLTLKQCSDICKSIKSCRTCKMLYEDNLGHSYCILPIIKCLNKEVEIDE